MEIKGKVQKETKQNKPDDTTLGQIDLTVIDKSEAYHMIHNAGIPLQFDDDGDVVLSNGELILGESLAFLTTAISSNHQIITTGESINVKELTESHIKKFIADYKTLEKEIYK